MAKSRPLISKALARTYLGLTLSARAVGYAVVADETLARYGTVTLRMIPTEEGRERRFAQVLVGLLDAYAPGHIVAVHTEGGSSHPGRLPETEQAWLRQESKTRTIRFSKFGSADVRDRFLPGGRTRSTRALADVLMKQFPSIRRGTLHATEAPGARYVPSLANAHRVRTSREAYWHGMFLALGACLMAQESDIHERLKNELL